MKIIKLISTLSFALLVSSHASYNIILISMGDILIPIVVEEKSVLVEGEVVLDQALLLSLVNTARISGRYCGASYYPPVNTIVWNTKIEATARVHSDDMYRNNFFSHTGSDASSAGDRLSRLDYTWRTWGENIAWGYSSEANVIRGWLDSVGHCTNIMNRAFTQMGVSRVGTYWTQVFATPR